MRSRAVYRYLIRLHPRAFRSGFEADMLWIFDETVQERGAAALMIDAVVSLVRQWVFRGKGQDSERTGHHHAALANGSTTSVSAPRRRPRLTWQIHMMLVALTFSIGDMVVLSVPADFPLVMRMRVCVIVLLITYTLFRIYKRRLSRTAFVAPSAVSHLPYRAQLEDTLKDVRSGKWVFSMILLHWLLILFGTSNAGSVYEIQWSQVVPGLAFATIAWLLVRQLDACAARTLQREMDAWDKSANSVPNR